MTILALALVLAVLLCWREWAMQRERNAWAAERAELLTRIQHPEIPVLPARPPAPKPDPDDFERIGSIDMEAMDGPGFNGR